MNTFRRAVFVLVVFVLVTTPAHVADFTTIDRTIKKEPVYKNKPKYCLIVFGPETKTRVWLVTDGRTAYVDRNGNGDLTEAGERLIANSEGFFEPGEITDRDGTRYKFLRFCESRTAGQPHVSEYQVYIQKNGGYFKAAIVPFGDSPELAPVVHFHGPLTFALSKTQGLVRGDKPADLSAYIFTPNPEKGSNPRAIAHIYCCDDGYPRETVFQKDIHPVAEIDFPNGKPTGSPIRIKVMLNKRC